MIDAGPQQPDLFGSASSLEPSVDAAFSTARRIPLDESSWIEHVPGWLSGSQTLLEQLLASEGWEQRRRRMWDQVFDEPRLTAEHATVADAGVPLLETVADALGARYHATYASLWVNLYRTHRDGTGWHGDAVGKRQPTSVVPVLSLGATRRFLIRPRGGGESVALQPSGGDLIVMGGRCQVDWQHSVPRQSAPAGARISVNFAPS